MALYEIYFETFSNESVRETAFRIVKYIVYSLKKKIVGGFYDEQFFFDILIRFMFHPSVIHRKYLFVASFERNKIHNFWELFFLFSKFTIFPRTIPKTESWSEGVSKIVFISIWFNRYLSRLTYVKVTPFFYFIWYRFNYFVNPQQRVKFYCIRVEKINLFWNNFPICFEERGVQIRKHFLRHVFVHTPNAFHVSEQTQASIKTSWYFNWNFDIDEGLKRLHCRVHLFWFCKH